MAELLEWISAFLPLTYAYDALERATQIGEVDATLLRDLGIVLGCIVVALVAGAATLRRRTA
jgi:ABC-2 type transport system permease protein